MKTFLAVLLLASVTLGRAAHAQGTGAPGGELRRHFEEAKTRAIKGDLAAQTQVGDFHREGKGAPPDYAEAARWYRKAAEQYCGPAQLKLGYCYFKGSGVTKDWAVFSCFGGQAFSIAQVELFGTPGPEAK